MNPPVSAVARADDIRAGIWLEAATVIWMIAESALALGSGVLARSMVLTAFGFDTLIELVSGLVLLWRLSSEARGADSERVELVERRSARISSVLLTVLCLYIPVTVALGLITHFKPQSSTVGLAVAIGAVIVMPVLAVAKRRVAGRIHSSALRADAAESITCAYMAGAVIVGLVLNAVLGWWWADYAAGLVFLFWLFGETREAFEAARDQHDDEDDDH